MLRNEGYGVEFPARQRGKGKKIIPGRKGHFVKKKVERGGGEEMGPVFPMSGKKRRGRGKKAGFSWLSTRGEKKENHGP